MSAERDGAHAPAHPMGRGRAGPPPGRPRARGRWRARAAPIRRLATYVRAFQVGEHQAQEGDRRLAPGRAVLQADAGDHGRRARRRRRSRRATRRSRTPSARPRKPRCRRTTSSARSPRAPARAARPTRSRAVLYEGYGPGGVARAGGGADREPQPHQRGRQARVLQERRQPRRARLGRLPVRQEGHDRDRRRALLRRRPDGRRGGRRRGHLDRRGRVRGRHRAGGLHGRAQGPRAGRRGDGERRDGLPRLEPRAARRGPRHAS